MALPALIIAVVTFAQNASSRDDGLQSSWDSAREALFARTTPLGEQVGIEGAFPLLWPSSDYLFSEERSRAALAALAWLVESAEQARDRPARERLLMQSDLWALSDWATPVPGYSSEHDELRLELARRTARALRVLAPSAEQLDGLPDNLAALQASWTAAREPDPAEPTLAFLPPGLGAEDSEWLRLDVEPLQWERPLAIAHAETFRGRAAFEVFLRVPGDRVAGEAFLATLRKHARLLDDDGSSPLSLGEGFGHLDPNTPDPPPGTQVALVRRLLAFDDAGALRVTPVVTGVQVRALHARPAREAHPRLGDPIPAGWPYQAFVELDFDRAAFLAGEPGLRAVQPGERIFDLFAAHGDEVERSDGSRYGEPGTGRLASCVACHGMAGSLSINAFTGTATGRATHLDISLSRPPRRLITQDRGTFEFRATRFKASRYEWGYLQGLWAAE